MRTILYFYNWKAILSFPIIKTIHAIRNFYSIEVINLSLSKKILIPSDWAFLAIQSSLFNLCSKKNY